MDLFLLHTSFLLFFLSFFDSLFLSFIHSFSFSVLPLDISLLLSCFLPLYPPAFSLGLFMLFVCCFIDLSISIYLTYPCFLSVDLYIFHFVILVHAAPAYPIAPPRSSFALFGLPSPFCSRCCCFPFYRASLCLHVLGDVAPFVRSLLEKAVHRWRGFCRESIVLLTFIHSICISV